MELNKIYLGDSYKLIKEIPDKSIDLIYTDIPYLFKRNGSCGNSELGQRMNKREDELKGRRKEVARRMEELKIKMSNATSPEEYERFRVQYNAQHSILNLITNQDITSGIDYSILNEFVRVLKHIYIYIWCSKEQIPDLLNYFIDKHDCKFNILVWCKTNPTPMTNNTWLPDIEYCLVFKGEGTPNYNDGYSLKSKWYASPINKSDKDLFEHPTIKPLELVERHLKHSTNENDVVLDPFLGSGTTALACKHLNRKYIGFEINEKYYTIAKDRLQGINQRGEMNLFDI